MVHVGLHYSDRIGKVRSLMVTSAASGEGKSTIAWHLACAAGSSGMRVLLIEADLRHGGTGTVLAGNRDKGLSFVLFGQDLAENTISGSEIGDESVVPPGLTLLPSGPQPPNTVKALASDRMREVIATGERDYDLVVLDTPPLATVSDAVPLLKEVDGVIPVARLGTTMRDGATALRRMLTELDAPVVGIVVNGTSALAGYGYSYGAQRDAAVDWSAIERSARERAAQRPPEDEEVGRTAGANGRPVAAEVPPEPILADASAPAPTPANHAEPRVTATVTHADAPSTAPRRGRRSTLRARLAALARGR
jgi:capsular exopolysaccharide synthesis family protein